MSEKRRTARASEGWADGITRRRLIALGAGTIVALAWPRPVRAVLGSDVTALLERSGFVYVSPLKRDGSESRCHAEVWFVGDGDSALVVTSAKAWRAQAIGKGLSRARVWVGDHGVWDPSGKERAFQAAPSFVAEAALEKAQSAHDHALALFGSKYTREWGSWGPRFQKGLADGSRVLIRYRAVAS